MSRSALFSADLEAPGPIRETMGEGAVLLRGKALAFEDELIAALAAITARAPFRRMVTPGGFVMSVAMTNCGAAGWVTDRRGYRYDGMDPETGQPWPDMPACFERLAAEATAEAGYPDFAPDACLVNRYESGVRLGLHQDRDEGDFAQPIVSVSLGVPADFLWGGLKRADKYRRIRVVNGDVAVWGGPTRMIFHGVAPLPEGAHPLTGALRYNLTFRRAR